MLIRFGYLAQALDKGIDGFRVDAITHIKKKEGFPDMPNPKGLDYVPSFPYHMNADGIMDFLTENAALETIQLDFIFCILF